MEPEKSVNPNPTESIEAIKPVEEIKIKVIETTVSVGTQTDEMKIGCLDTVPPVRKIARPRNAFPKPHINLDIASEACGETDKCTTRNKACQTVKTGVKRSAAYSQMDHLRALMFQRRKLAIDQDRRSLETLMTKINADPPPPWHAASLMWLEVDKLENRIEEFDKEHPSV